jgi:hypothetical protein
VVEIPSIVNTVSRKTVVPFYNNSDYKAVVYIRGIKAGEMLPGFSTNPIASVPFSGMEIPVVAMMYNNNNNYVGCYTEEVYLSEYRTEDVQINNKNINYLNENKPTGSYKGTNWFVKKIDVPNLKHTMMVYVVNNNPSKGVLRINGQNITRFTSNKRFHYIEKNLLNKRRTNVHFDIKYQDGQTINSYSRKKQVYFQCWKPRAEILVFN